MSNIICKKPIQTAIAIAISASFGATSHAAEVVKSLPTVDVQSTIENDYKKNESTSFKYTKPIAETAKTIQIIPEELLQDRAATSLKDALRNVSGITLAAGEGGAPPGDSVTIRGFSATNDISIDNIRDIAGYARDIYNVEALEVTKGPGSAVTGRGATGGSINLQTKTASQDDINSLGVRFGSEDDYRVTFDSNTSIGESSAIRVNVLSDDGDVADRDEVENSTNAVAVSFVTGINTRSRLTVNADYQEQDNLPDYGIPWVSNGQDTYAPELLARAGTSPDVDFSNFYGNVFRDFEEIEAKSLTAIYEYDISDTTTFRTQARVGDVSRLSIVSAPRFISIGDSTDVRLSDEKTRDTRNSLALIQFDFVGKYTIGSTTHDIVTGIEIASEEETRFEYDDNGTDNLDTTPELVDLFNPNARVAYTGTYERTGGRTEASGDTTAFYLFDTITFNPKWSLTLGARVDEFESEFQFDFDDPSLVQDKTDSFTSWSTGLVYKPTENGNIYFGAGTSFNPSAEDLTASTRGNTASLDPEETYSLELGTKWELFDDRLLLNAAIFRTEKTNARTDDPFADDDRADTLDGEQRVDGFELGIVGNLSDNVSITAAYTYQDSEVTSANGDDIAQLGSELARTPENSLSLWGNYTVNSKLSVGLGGQYIDERFNNTNAETRERADSYVTLDALVAYNINEQTTVRLNVTNMFDEEYEDQLGGGHFIPGEGRHFLLSANYSF